MKSVMRLVHEFRNAMVYTIEFDSYSILNFDGWVALNGFPSGCCVISSDLLGEYLIENGISAVKVIEVDLDGNNKYGVASHAWLEVENKYIDLTASQFPNLSSSRILVQGKFGSESLFSLVADAKSNGVYSERDPNVNNFLGIYEIIKHRIRRNV